MPIKGLTDRLPSFPQIGTIRKGAEKRERRPGEDLTYFRVVFSDGEDKAAERFHELYGDEPQDITVMLPFNEIDRSWEAWKEAYLAGAMIHRCDGEYVQYALDPDTGEVTVRGGASLETGEVVLCDGRPVCYYTVRTGQRQGSKVPNYCKPRGRLRVMVPELRRAAYLLLLTSSVHDILNISAQLKAIKQLNGGQLRGIPLVLRRRPRMISTPGQNGKRVRREKWLVSIEADPEWVGAKVAQLEASALPEMPLLDEPAEAESPVKGEVRVVEDKPMIIHHDAQGEFLARVCDQIPYYSHPLHVANTLAKLELEYSQDEEDALLDVLNDYANKRPDEDTAAQVSPPVAADDPEDPYWQNEDAPVMEQEEIPW